ncbi:MAG: branched-chain amino acid ABC transporter permease [Deltaproteobacteria bacterium]|nr:branched-chain amino acid ABC transporter permease [Deltaproteobacteria bacterium]RLA90838.1 MAG: branched-chain amino acid ABC transporter permease [Deltaproteobacteria bacterium]
MVIIDGIVNGVALGCVYALIALGFVLIYKATKIINFAQGEIMMFSSYICYTFITFFHFNFILSFVLAVFAGFLLGSVLEKLFIRPLIGYPILPVVIATIGISMVLQAIAGLLWTFEPQKMDPFPMTPHQFWKVTISPVHLWTIIITVALMIIFFVFFRYTILGISLRAIAEDLLGSMASGIAVRRMFNFTWGLASALSAIAGVLVAPIVFLHPHMGVVGLRALPAAVLGSFGSIPGAIVGGLVLGLSETIAGLYLPKEIKDVFPWLVLFVVLIIKPEGIFYRYEQKKV